MILYIGIKSKYAALELVGLDHDTTSRLFCTTRWWIVQHYCAQFVFKLQHHNFSKDSYAEINLTGISLTQRNVDKHH